MQTSIHRCKSLWFGVEGYVRGVIMKIENTLEVAE